MKITFYYLEGISDVNTPSFFCTNGAGVNHHKEKLFAEYKMYELDSNTYYPPHYRNIIKVSTEDVALNTSVNYLSLYYNNKYYYYFIEYIEYINESVYAISIRMDTVTTFAEDIFLEYGIVERMHIDRWVRRSDIDIWDINRNYIRENFSTEDYVLKEDKSFIKTNDFDNNTTDVANGVYVGILSEGEYSPGNYSKFGCQYSDKDSLTVFTTPYTIYMLPINFDKNTNNYNKINSTLTNIRCPVNKSMVKLGENAKLFDLLFIPCNPFYDDFICTKSTDYLEVNVQQGSVRTTVAGEISSPSSGNEYTISGLCYHNLGLSTDNALFTETLKYKVTYGFTRNTQTEVSLLDIGNTSEPFIFDENYIKYEFGDKTTNTVCPLYLINSDSVNCCYTIDLISCSRIYYFKGHNTVTVDTSSNARTLDELQTKVINSNSISGDILSNEYNQWRVQNRATGYYLMADSVIDTVSTFFGSIPYGSSTKGRTISDVVTEKGMSSRVSYYDSYSKSTPDAHYNTGYTGIVKSALDYHETNINKALAGSFGKCSNAVSSSIISNYSNIHFKKYEVADIDKVAQMYRMFGSKVYEVVQTRSALMTLCRSRYYYNFIKMKEIDIHLRNYVNDAGIIDDIIRRFTDGIRFWHYDIVDDSAIIRMEDGINQYYYDNVEVAFL